MDKIILGLLILKDMTMYDIKNIIKKNFGPMCSDSIGSLQAAIKKLIKNEMIVFNEFVEKGKNKKVYNITNLGRQYFLVWVRQPMDIGKSKNMELSKLFFMGLVAKKEQFNLIDDYISKLKNEERFLNVINDATKNISLSLNQYINKIKQDKSYSQFIQNTSEENIYDIIKFQLLTLKFSLDSIKFEINWYEDLKQNLEKEVSLYEDS